MLYFWHSGHLWNFCWPQMLVIFDIMWLAPPPHLFFLATELVSKFNCFTLKIKILEAKLRRKTGYPRKKKKQKFFFKKENLVYLFKRFLWRTQNFLDKSFVTQFSALFEKKKGIFVRNVPAKFRDFSNHNKISCFQAQYSKFLFGSKNELFNFKNIVDSVLLKIEKFPCFKFN